MAANIDAAIATARMREAPLVWKGSFRLPSTGREVRLELPADISPVELVEAVGFLSTQLPRQLAEARRARPSILVPT